MSTASPAPAAASAAQGALSPAAATRGIRGRLRAGGWRWPVGIVVVAVLLFLAYLRLSWTYQLNSDSANIELMAWDMLHGNLLLHGWSLSDVSFYTTELPQYALLEALLGPGAGTAHVAAAMTYTLVVVVAVLLAKGRSTGAEAVVRVLLVAGIMLAPQTGPGVFALALSVGHIGTAVPVLVTWLVIDRSRQRWYVPVVAGVLLAWALVADSLVLLVGVAPLVLVCGLRAARAGWTAGSGGAAEVRRALRSRWYELSLAGAALAAVVAAWAVGRALGALGGYYLHSVPYSLTGWASVGRNLRLTAEGLLVLFGADFVGARGGRLFFAVLHLAGVALALWAMALVLRRFLTTAGLLDQVLWVAVVLNVALYLPSSLVTLLNARELTVALPCAVVLTARALARRLAGRGRLMTVLAAVVLAGCALGLAGDAAQRPQPPANSTLAAWLAGHHFTHGLSGYWQASSVTVDSDRQVTVRALLPNLEWDAWESKPAWYDPKHNRADFLVLDSQPGFFNRWEPDYHAVVAKFGAPVRTYRFAQYTVLVWQKNLLADVGG